MNEQIQEIKKSVTKLMNGDNNNLVLQVIDLLNKLVDNNEN